MSITRDYPGNERAMVKPRKARKTRVRQDEVALRRAGDVFRRHLAGEPWAETANLYRISRRTLQRILKSLPDDVKEHIRRARNRGYIA